jgi:hypothetical protein
VASRPIAKSGLDPAVLPQGQVFGEEHVDRFRGADLPALQSPYDLIQRLKRAKHLQAHKIMADPIERALG